LAPLLSSVSCQHHQHRRRRKHSAGRIAAQVAWRDHWGCTDARPLFRWLHTGFWWGSGSPTNWLLTDWQSAGHSYSNVSQRAGTNPCITSGSALIRCSAADRSSHTHQTGPSRFLCCCSLPGTLYLLTFDCENIITFKRHMKTHLLRLT